MSTTEKKPSEEHLDPKAQAEHHDEVIVVPAGQRRWRFYFTFGVIIFVLLTFMVSDLVVPALSRGGDASTAYAVWKSSDGEEHVISAADFGSEKRRLQPLVAFAFGLRDRDPSDDQLAAFLVLEHEAELAGVHATDDDLKRFIKASFPDPRNYDAFLRSYRTSKREFETLLRRVVRYLRYRELLSYATRVPAPDEIERQWKTQHQEFAADFVELPVASLEAEARAGAPDADALRAWYDALPAPEKAAFLTKEMVSAELVAFSFESSPDTAALFERYPRPAEEDAEQKGRDFHAGFGYALYRRDQPQPGQDFRKDFEEVREDAVRNAKIYNSLMDWRANVATRLANGETVDLAAEASALGLSYRMQAEPLTRERWQELTVPWISTYVLGHMFDAAQSAGPFRSVVVEPKGFVFGRVTGKQPPRQPDYAEVTDAVLDAWGRSRAKELALAKLESVRDALGTRPDPADTNAPPFKPEVEREKFLEAARTAGFEPQRRDWAEQFPPMTPETDTDATRWFRSNPALFANKQGSVPAPEVERGGKFAYLVRLDGSRDPDVARMSPLELQQTGDQIVRNEGMQFAQMELMSRQAMESRFGLKLASWEQPQPQ
jgi:hypothetical protein